jgi:hypothetical protein
MAGIGLSPRFLDGERLAWGGWLWPGGLEKGRKQFFFAKKNQKTFDPAPVAGFLLKRR